MVCDDERFCTLRALPARPFLLGEIHNEQRRGNGRLRPGDLSRRVLRHAFARSIGMKRNAKFCLDAFAAPSKPKEE
jgi:hypothetical protein